MVTAAIPVPAEWARIVAYEAALSAEDRSTGIHYTPWPAAVGLVGRALDAWTGSGVPRVVDPTCGAGSFLLAAAEVLVARGAEPEIVVDRLAGIDLDRAAVATCRTVLDDWSARHALRSGRGRGSGPAIEVGDVFDRPIPGRVDVFDLVIGNPPFQGQLTTRSARTTAQRRRLAERWGPAARGYVDTAALALLAALDLAAPTGVVAMIQPRSFLAAEAAAGIRDRLTVWGDVHGVWLPHERIFDAEVDVCAVVASRVPCGASVELWGSADASSTLASVSSEVVRSGRWASMAAVARGVPDVVAPGVDTLGDGARVVAGFRDEFYAMAAAVDEETPGADQPRAVTVGLIDPARLDWGARSTRIAGHRWERPVVDLARLERDAPAVRRWVEPLRVPKVVVATQTEILEAVVDPTGDLLGLTPTLSVVGDRWSPELILAALLAPPASVWAQHAMAGSGRSAHTLRVGAPTLRALPMPVVSDAWTGSASALARGGGWEQVGRLGCAAWGLPEADTERVMGWWLPRVTRRAPALDR